MATKKNPYYERARELSNIGKMADNAHSAGKLSNKKHRKAKNKVKELELNLNMKVILTINKSNKDKENFTRELELTMRECEYLKDAARIINQKGGESFLSVHVSEI